MNTENESVPVAQRSEALRKFLREVKKGWTDTQIDAILDAKGYCEFCGADVVGSPEAFWSSPWDHIVPKAFGGEHEKKPPWRGKLKEVFQKNIAVVCWKCNNLKGRKLPGGVDAKDLLDLGREQRIEKVRPWVQQLRRDYEVVQEFAAFRELVEMVRCSAN